LLVVLCAGVIVLAGWPAYAIEWSEVQGKTVTLFYPGQASWEWVLSKSEHPGAQPVREGKTCKTCHVGWEKNIGAAIAAGKRREPDPIPNQRGSIAAEIKFAHNGDRLYVRIRWPATAGIAKQDAEYAAKVAMMIDDGKILEAARAGCWGACHDDAAGMASAGGGERRKYLARSRVKNTRQGGDTLKPKAELDAMLAEGQFLEYWQARLNPGAPAVAVDGRILAAREDSANPIVAAVGTLEDGNWVAVLSRKLKPEAAGYKTIAPGKIYDVGFAIHDDYAAGRRHHVSLGYTMAIDEGNVDFTAMKK
jgi:cytochrome c-type protein NapC